MAMNFEDMVMCDKCKKEFHENEVIYDEANDVDLCPYCGSSDMIVIIFSKHRR